MISANDKDFKTNFSKLLELATRLVYQFENEVQELRRDSTMKKIEQEKVDEDFFDTLKEEFLDEVYGSESKLTRADYMDHLSKR